MVRNNRPLHSPKPGPVLLVNKDSVPSAVHDYLVASDKVTPIVRGNLIALGGPAVISDENLKTELDAIAPEVEAKGSINFGSYSLEADDDLKLPVTYKDLPSGTTVVATWEVKVGTQWVPATTSNLAAASVNNTIAGEEASIDNLVKATAEGKTVHLKVEVKSGDQVVMTAISTDYTIPATLND